MTGPDRERLSPCVCSTLRMVSRAVTQLDDDILRPSGLRVTQFSILGAIARLGEANLRQLEHTLAIDQTTLTRSLKLLEGNGAIDRVPHPDGPLASGRRQEARADSRPEPCPAKARTKRKPLMPIERRMRGRVHYGWIVVAVTFVTLLAAAGIRSAPGVLIIPLEREFGWTRATVSFAVSINLFLYGLSGPFVAGLMDRRGSQREPKRPKRTCVRSANLRRVVRGASGLVLNREGLITQRSLVQIQSPQPRTSPRDLTSLGGLLSLVRPERS